MADDFTTMRVFVKDRELLLERYGGPTHEALRKAVDGCCPHPEDKRTYVVAALPKPGQEVMTSDKGRQNLGGFYCNDCGSYVFKLAPPK